MQNVISVPLLLELAKEFDTNYRLERAQTFLDFVFKRLSPGLEDEKNEK